MEMNTALVNNTTAGKRNDEETAMASNYFQLKTNGHFKERCPISESPTDSTDSIDGFFVSETSLYLMESKVRGK